MQPPTAPIGHRGSRSSPGGPWPVSWEDLKTAGQQCFGESLGPVASDQQSRSGGVGTTPSVAVPGRGPMWRGNVKPLPGAPVPPRSRRPPPAALRPSGRWLGESLMSQATVGRQAASAETRAPPVRPPQEPTPDPLPNLHHHPAVIAFPQLSREVGKLLLLCSPKRPDRIRAAQHRFWPISGPLSNHLPHGVGPNDLRIAAKASAWLVTS